MTRKPSWGKPAKRQVDPASPPTKSEPELEPEPKSKSKPASGSAMLAAFVKEHAPSEALK